MLDPRTKDAVRQTAVKLEEFNKRLARIEEVQTMSIALIRAIKNSVVRKWGKKK